MWKAFKFATKYFHISWKNEQEQKSVYYKEYLSSGQKNIFFKQWTEWFFCLNTKSFPVEDKVKV